MKTLVLGYPVTTVATIINSLWQHIHVRQPDDGYEIDDESQSRTKRMNNGSNPSYLPGEGNAVVELLQQINQYLAKKSELLPFEFWNTSAIDYLYAVDSLLSMSPEYILPDVIYFICII